MKTKLLVLRLSLATLPFTSYLSLMGLISFIIMSLTLNNQELRKLLKSHNIIIFITLSTFIVFAITCMVAINKQESLLSLANFFPFFLLFYALILTLNVQKYEQILKNLLVIALPIIILAIIEFIFGLYGIFNFNRFISASSIIHARSTSVFANSNVLANYLIIILSFLLGNLLSFLRQVREISQKSVLSVKLYIVLAILAIACSQSRNACITGLILIFIANFTAQKKYKRFFISIAFGLIASFLICSYIIHQRYLNGQTSRYLVAVPPPLISVEVNSRTKIWQTGISLARQHPFFGSGFGSYKLLYPVQSVGKPNHPHNLWVMLLCESGILGTLSLNLFVGFIFYKFFMRFQKLHQDVRNIITCYMLAFIGSIIFNLFDCTFFDARINTLNWLSLSAIYSLSEKK